MNGASILKILVLYYSGVGNTKMVATKIFEILNDFHEITVISIEKLPKDINITIYDALVIGFPTIHSSPAKPIMDFIEQIKHLQKPVPAFLFTTCGLYPANSLRIFAQKCVKKNITPILSKSYRCSAADGTLIAPFMNIWFRHEKRLDEKIQNNVRDFVKLQNQPLVARIPRFKLYSILNYPNKFFGQRFCPKIYLHIENCVSCGKCIKDCPTKSIDNDDEGYPFIKNESCIHCYRCIHHCAGKALSLSKKRPPLKTLYY